MVFSAMNRILLTASLALAALAPVQAADLAESADAILEQNCRMCHGAAMQLSKLDLRNRDGILKGGERGAAVVVGNLKFSLLWGFVNHQRKPEMPPGKKLSEDQIETLRQWIMAGAPLPAKALTDQEAARLEALKKLEDRPLTPEERAFWAFRPPVKRETPNGAHPVDAFLSSVIVDKKLTPAAPADKRTLVRRAYLDLVGLPPTPDEVAAFVNDPATDAFQSLIDKLLASPHYGERWGRHWLDLVHYADSGGYERDFDWPTMWRYRGYVVDAFNNDKPYDLFLREQLAGDEIAPDSAESNIATGYLRLVLDNNIKDERTRMDELDDYVATTSLAFLGMTTGCARCHNHKFDPIPQKDYYRMQAVFFSTKDRDYPLVSPETVAALDAADSAIDDKQDPLRESVREIEAPYREQIFKQKLQALPGYYRASWETPPAERDEGQRLNARQVEAMRRGIKSEEVLARLAEAEKAERLRLLDEIAALDEQRPEPYPTARTITEEGRDPFPSYFLHRGNPDSKGSRMEPGVLSVAARSEVSFPEPPPTASTSGRRRAFADWIASKDNPLTARVMVNRIWQHHFGEGIARTPSNFGTTGEPPSHPELLDWLAVEFVESGWSVKHMHRLMMTSAAYQRASDDVAANLKIERDNRSFWRMPRTRLEAEILRDSTLAVAGTLDLTLGGPAVHPYINPSLFQGSTGRTWPGQPIGDRAAWRRSLYVFSKRSIRYPMFEAFDQPDMVASCDRRARSTVAPQALLLMNNAGILMQARFFAQRLQLEAGPELDAQIDRAFKLALARPPRESEKAQAKAFIESGPHGLVDFCQTLFNLNEFVYRP